MMSTLNNENKQEEKGVTFMGWGKKDTKSTQEVVKFSDLYFTGQNILEYVNVKETFFPYKCKQSVILIFLVKYFISKPSMVKKDKSQPKYVLNP